MSSATLYSSALIFPIHPRTRSNLVLVLTSDEPSWAPFLDAFVSLTHSFSAMTDCKRRSLSRKSLRHGPHRKRLLLLDVLTFLLLTTGYGADSFENKSHDIHPVNPSARWLLLLTIVLLLCDLTTDCLPRICLRGNLLF
jgi:hypothetical protein